MPLFNRNTNPISLTEAGQCYIEYAEQIMALQAQMQERFSQLSAHADTHLHIGSSMFFCTYVLPRMLAEFRAQYPQITLSFTEGDNATLMERLQEGHLDFVLEAEAPEAAGLDSLVWASEQIVLAVPRAWDINRGLEEYCYSFQELLGTRQSGWSKPPVPLERFRDEEFLFLKRGNDIYKRGMALCKAANFVPRVSSYLEQMMTAYYLVCEGMGITFLRSTIPAYVVPSEHVVFYRLDGPLAHRNLYLSYRKRGGSPVQKKLIRYMQEKGLTPEPVI